MAKLAQRAPWRRLWLLVAIIALFAVASSSLMAEGAGRLVADLWVTTMGAIAGLIGGLFGG